MRLIIVFTVCLLSMETDAQEIGLSNIPFFIDQNQLPLAFAGGLRAPQFNTTDLNLDGREDLVIYERDGKVIIPLVRNPDGSLSYAPHFRDIFPDIPSWMLLRDYNDDGIKDLFCSPVNIGIPGIEVYQGKVVEGSLEYELVEFPKNDFDILVVPIGNTETQIFVSVIDMPDIRDLDSDGDLDIVAFEPSGSTVYLYRNLAIERNFSLDSLIFELDENCYGGFVESGFSQEVSLSPDPGVCASFFWEMEELAAASRHSGSTVLSVDVTGDTLTDILLGDISYDGLVMLTNTGTSGTAHFTSQETRFPPGPEPVDIELFVSAFYEDVTGDGRSELIAAPNDRFSSQTTDHIWTYSTIENDNSGLQFTLTAKNFLVEDMIYPGPNTAPVFHDFNGDGFEDLLIGTSGLSEDGIAVNPRLILYEHSGDAGNPSFHLTNDDFLQMAAFRTTSRHFAPAVGDLDGDGDMDIILGDNNGRLYFIENVTSEPGEFNFLTPVYNAFDIKVSAWARPAIFDFNNDGLGDLVIGEQNFNSFNGKRGSLNYFENIGEVGSAAFDSNESALPNDPIFGRINLKESGFINNYSAPQLLKIEDKLIVATGTARGFIRLYDTDASMPSDSFTLISNAYGNIREGENSIISFSDINRDNYLEMAVGTRRGGLAIYHTDLFVDLSTATGDVPEATTYLLYPNPVHDVLNLELPQGNDDYLSFSIYSTTGQRVTYAKEYAGHTIDVAALEPGVYFLKLELDKGSFLTHFVKVQF